MIQSIARIGILVAAAAVWSTAAQAAPIYEYDISNPNQNNAAGQILNISTSFDAGSSQLSWTHQIADVGSKASNGFWLVLSGGANPKGTVDQLAIFYGDAAKGVLTAYEYNGQNNASSYSNPANLLGTYALNYSHDAGVGTFNFDFDASVLNDYTQHSNLSSNWEGAQFGQQIGIWFHPTLGATFKYDSQGAITSLNTGTTGWHDSANQQTITQVPEPATLALFGLALTGFGLSRRRRA